MYLSLSPTVDDHKETKSLTLFTFALSMDVIKTLDAMPNGINVCHNLPHGERFDMDDCIRKFYVKQMGCLSPWESGPSLTNYPICQNISQHEGDFVKFYDYLSIKVFTRFFRIPENQEKYN